MRASLLRVLGALARTNYRRYGNDPPGIQSSNNSVTSFYRNNIQRSSARLRQIISSTEFTTLFGEARPDPQGQRRNIFGREDELKVAPKGVDKNHPLVRLILWSSKDHLTMRTGL